MTVVIREARSVRRAARSSFPRRLLGVRIQMTSEPLIGNELRAARRTGTAP